jgi:type I restriction enzyme S subunit
MRFPGFEEDWEEHSIGNILKIGSGKDYKHLSEGNIPVFGTGGYMTSVNKYLFDGETVCIGRKGTINKPFYFNGKLWTVDTLFFTHSFQYVIPKFLFYVFEEINWLKYNEASGVPSLSKTTIEQILISIPNINEQKKIASILSTIDERIQTQNEIIGKYESLMKGLSGKLFIEKLRFKKGKENDFQKWQSKFGNEVFKSVSNKNHNSDLPILAISQEHGAIPRHLIDYNITVTDKSIDNYKIIEVGDFIISLRSFQGGIEYSEYKGICSPAYIILRPFIAINNLFFKYYFKTDKYITELNKKIEGIRDGKMISYKYFSEIKLPFPSLDEQQKISSFLFSINEKIKIEKSILNSLTNQKQYLLQQLLI